MMEKIIKLWLVGGLLAAAIAGCAPQVIRVSTVAGSTGGYAEGIGAAAMFSVPLSVAVDEEGNLYVADSANRRVRKIAPDGTVTTVAGSGQAGSADGPALEATFGVPTGVALAPSGVLYIADSVAEDPHPLRLRLLTLDGMVTTLAGSLEAGYKDGSGTGARFRSPAGIAVDAQGNIYVADTNNHRIRRVSPTGEVTTLAGSPNPGYVAGYADGSAAEARFQHPRSVAVDAQGNVYVADAGNNCIRKITPDGQVTTFAGSREPGYVDGKGTEARFNSPSGIAVDAQGNVYVADTANHRVRKITPDGMVTTLAGSGQPGNADGPATEAQFRAPEGVAVDAKGNVYVADTGNHRVRKIIVR
ncbi:MAG: NHL repeat-containing protein [Anaerolineae bacterium]|nr:NHL repeat-containing protein [Anaerolineae bacterium]